MRKQAWRVGVLPGDTQLVGAGMGPGQRPPTVNPGCLVSTSVMLLSSRLYFSFAALPTTWNSVASAS